MSSELVRIPSSFGSNHMNFRLGIAPGLYEGCFWLAELQHALLGQAMRTGRSKESKEAEEESEEESEEEEEEEESGARALCLFPWHNVPSSSILRLCPSLYFFPSKVAMTALETIVRLYTRRETDLMAESRAEFRAEKEHAISGTCCLCIKTTSNNFAFTS